MARQGVIPDTSTCDVAVLESIPFGPCQPHPHDTDLIVFHGLWLREPINSNIPELICKYLAAIAKVSPRNDQQQNADALEQAIHMIGEQPLHALRSLLADLEIIRRVQIDQREGFHRALHVKAVAVDHLDAFISSLLGAAGVQLNAIAQNSFVRSDLSEGCTIAHTRIQRAAVIVRSWQQSPDPLRLWNRQWVEAATRNSSEP